MQFHEAIKAGFRNYAQFNGRASRSEFWWWMLFTALVSAALSAIPIWPTVSWMGSAPSAQPPSGLAGIWSVVVLLHSLGLTVRRLRDSGRSWRNLFWIVLPLAGLIVLAVLCAQPSVAQRDVRDRTFAPTQAVVPKA